MQTIQFTISAACYGALGRYTLWPIRPMRPKHRFPCLSLCSFSLVSNESPLNRLPQYGHSPVKVNPVPEALRLRVGLAGLAKDRDRPVKLARRGFNLGEPEYALLCDA